MKRMLAVFALLVVLAIAAAVVFFITFDADRFRPMVEQRLSEAAKRPVTIERLGLGWHGGVSIDVHGLRILDEEPLAPDQPAEPGAPILDVDRVSAVLRLLPLLRKQVQIESVEVLRPRARIFRDEHGRLNLLGAAAPVAPAAVPAQAQAHGSPVTFLVDRVNIDDGLVQWTDEQIRPPMTLEIDQLDVVLRNVTPASLDFHVRAAAFSNDHDLTLEGHCELPGEGRAGALERVRAELDLGQIQPRALQEALPSLDMPALRQGLAGRLTATVERLPLDPKQLQEATAQVMLEDGRVAVPSLGSPIEGLALEATVRADSLHITRCDGSLASGRFALRGVVAPLTAQPRADLTLSVERVSLEGLLPTPSADAPHLRGLMSLEFTGGARGGTWPQIAQSLTGNGRLQLRDGALANINVVRMVFEQLAVLPAVVDRLQAKLPPHHRERLNQRDTLLKPIDQPLSVANGTATLPDAHFETDLAALDGTVTLSLLQPTVSGRLMLAIEPELSAAIVDSIHELQTLSDAQGRLALPVIVQAPGRPPVMPDLQYVGARVIATTAQELLGNVLNKYLAPQTTEPAAPSSAPPARP